MSFFSVSRRRGRKTVADLRRGSLNSRSTLNNNKKTTTEVVAPVTLSFLTCYSVVYPSVLSGRRFLCVCVCRPRRSFFSFFLECILSIWQRENAIQVEVVVVCSIRVETRDEVKGGGSKYQRKERKGTEKGKKKKYKTDCYYSRALCGCIFFFVYVFIS